MSAFSYSHLLILIFFSVSACSDIEFSDESSGWSFKSTEVISMVGALANNTDEAVVRLRVYDRMGQPLEGLQLRSHTSANDINFKRCQPSDENGYTNCYFTSSVIGTRTTDIFDNFGKIKVDVTFNAIPQVRFLSKTSPSSRVRTVDGGYTITSELKEVQGFRNNVGGNRVNTQTIFE
jgi:hypothetical protein